MRLTCPIFNANELLLVKCWASPPDHGGPGRDSVGLSFLVKDYAALALAVGTPGDQSGLEAAGSGLNRRLDVLAAEINASGRDLHLEAVDYRPGNDLSATNPDETAPAMAGTDQTFRRLVYSSAATEAVVSLFLKNRCPNNGSAPEVLIAADFQSGRPVPIHDRIRLEQLLAYVEESGCLALMHPDDLATLGIGSKNDAKSLRRISGLARLAEIVPPSQWKAHQIHRKRLPPSERIRPLLTEEGWERETASFLELVPLPHNFIQPATEQSVYGWHEVLRAVAPSCQFGPEVDQDEPFIRVPVSAGSLLESALDTHKNEIFANNRSAVRPNRHVIICAPTGTGKTTLGLLMLANECLELGLPVIYIGPTRMLVEENYNEFIRLLEVLEGCSGGSSLIGRDQIILSTGEFYDQDRLILDGHFKAAFIIFEKANNFFIKSDLVSKLGTVVIDEAHMLADAQRGGHLDMVLSRLNYESGQRAHGRSDPLRMVVCSTESLENDQALRHLCTLNGPVQDLEPIIMRADNRPRDIQIWIQPSHKHYSCLPIPAIEGHISRTAPKLADIAVEDSVIDRGAQKGSYFFSNAISWMSGHDRVLFVASGSAKLSQFAKLLIKQRAELPSVINEEDDWLEDMRTCLSRQGLPLSHREFILKAARHGVFFHYAGLERYSRAMSVSAFRSFQPRPGQPLVLCATETIGYGVNLPADLLILETAIWPRTDLQNQQVFKLLTPNEFRNLIGRVGRYGHSNSELASTVVINWSIINYKDGKQEDHRGTPDNSRNIKEKYQNIISLCTAEPSKNIACDLMDQLHEEMLNTNPHQVLADYPPAATKFFLEALLHSHAIRDHRPCTIDDIYSFLNHTYTCTSRMLELETVNRPKKPGHGRSRLQGFWAGAPNIAGTHFFEGPEIMIKRNLENFYKLAAQAGNCAILEWVGNEGYLPTKLGFSMSRNDISILTLLEINEALTRFTSLADRYPQHFGLLALFSVLLTTEMWRYCLPFVWEGRQYEENGEPDIQKNDLYEELALAALRATLLALHVPPDLSAESTSILDQCCSDWQARYSFARERKSWEGRNLSIMFRICVAFLRWVEGRLLGDIHDLGFPELKPWPNSNESLNSSLFNIRYSEKSAAILDCLIILKESGAPCLIQLESLRQMQAQMRYGLPYARIKEYQELRKSKDITREEWLLEGIT